jgi:predicted nucleotidyltransferase
MRRDPEGRRRAPADLAALAKHFDRQDVAAAYLFGSIAGASPHGLSDLDLAYLGTSSEAEDRRFKRDLQDFGRISREEFRASRASPRRRTLHEPRSPGPSPRRRRARGGG